MKRVLDVALTFRNYWTSKTGAGATKLNWERTWQNWCVHERDPRPTGAAGRHDARQEVGKAIFRNNNDGLDDERDITGEARRVA